ncbi:MAG: hypothetical protein WC471_04205 [Candidatus Woesearchaeota archaeon]
MADILDNLKKAMQPANASANNAVPETPKEEAASKEQISEFIEKLNNLTRAIRTIEERYNNLRRKSQLTDHNILVQHQRLNKELRLNDSDLIDIKRGLQKINDKLNMLEKELDVCAKKNELDVLAKYIGYWRPMEFVTRGEAEKIINAAILEKGPRKEEPEKKPLVNRLNNGERSVY